MKPLTATRPIDTLLRADSAVLQLALDEMGDANRVLELADAGVRGGAEWLEIGTPTLKAFGLGIAKSLRMRHPAHTLVIDSKIADAAELEIRAFASELGHRLIITVLAAANLSTIKNAVRQAERFEEIYIAVDLIGLDPEAAIAHAKLAEECGADICIAHLAIDEQLRGQEVNPDWVRTLSRELSIPIAVAGGLNAQTAPMVVEAGASIIIVGSAITKSADPQAETRRIRRAITHAALQTSR